MRVYIINGKKFLNFGRFLFLLLAMASVISLAFHLISGNIGAIIQSSLTYASEDSERVIVIDPGHGGEDPGAVGVNGIYEKDLNLQISLLIGEMLDEKGYTVVYTRTSDKMLYSEEENIKGLRKLSDLKNRCKISMEYDDPIFLSIHMNSFAEPKYTGLQVYYSKDNDNSAHLASRVQTAVKREIQTNNNRVCKSTNGLYLLENCNGTGILIECGFLTNKEECEKLSQKEYQKQLSFAIVCGIIEYIEEKN